MAEAAAQAAPEADTQAAPEAAPDAPAASAVVDDSPFDAETLAKRPDLAAKYGPKKGTKAAAKADEEPGKDAEGSNPDEPEAEAKPEDDQPPEAKAAAKREAALSEIAKLAEDPEIAKRFLEMVAEGKSPIGTVAAAARKLKRAVKIEAQTTRRERALAQGQQDLVAMVDEFRKDPKGHARRHGFDFRAWLAEQVAEESVTPEQKKIRELEQRHAEVEASLSEIKQREANVRAAEADHSAITKLHGILLPADYPNITATHDATAVARAVWKQVKDHYIETGVELDPHKILRQEEDRLTQIHERLSRAKRTVQAPQGVRSEREGAVQSAQHAGTKEPTSISTVDATQRASGDRPMTRQERLDSILARAGIR